MQSETNRTPDAAAFHRSPRMLTSMEQRRRNDDYQWWKFLEHWGLLGHVVIVLLMMQVFLFFVNLTGTAWVCFLAGSFALMLSGAALIVYAKMPAYRSGRFFSFGVKSVPEHLARHYRWGWRLFLAGMVVALCLLLSRHDMVNKAAASNCRPRFAFGALCGFGYSVCAPSGLLAEVGESHRWLERLGSK